MLTGPPPKFHGSRDILSALHGLSRLAGIVPKGQKCTPRRSALEDRLAHWVIDSATSRQ